MDTAATTPSDDAHFSTRNADGTVTCGACRERVRPRGPDPLAYLAAPAAIGLTFVGLPLIAVLPPLNMMLVPPTFLVIAGIWGFTSHELFDDKPCPACRRALVFKKR